jgi:hypothetical protein
VGDQPADVTAAQEAGFRFLGVTYGWGIIPDDHEFGTAGSVLEIPYKIRELELSLETLSELTKLQFDFAWKWFNYHADQRVKMFNFMLIMFGIFATAIVTAVDKKLPLVLTLGLCSIAATLALIFARLDTRNRRLVWMGEDVLVELERQVVFGRKEIVGRYGEMIKFGLLWRQIQQNEPLIGRNKIMNKFWDAWDGKHRIWLPGIPLLLGLMFIAAGFVIWWTARAP